MKKTNFLKRASLLCLAMATVFTSCKDKTLPGVTPLPDTPTKISLTAAGSAVAVNFTANADWTATSPDAWVKIAPASGKANGKATVNVSTALYNTPIERKSTITIVSGADKIVLPVVQAAATKVIAFDPAKVMVDKSLTAEFNVTSNVVFTVKSAPAWATVTVKGGAAIVVGKNVMVVTVKGTDPAVRTGNVVLAAEGVTDVNVPVEVVAIADIKGKMVKGSFAANDNYVMPTKLDVTITNPADVEFEFTALTVGADNAATTTKATWLTFAKNAEVSTATKLVWTATAAAYESKDTSRGASIYLAPKGTTAEDLIAAKDRFLVKTVKQMPDAVRFFNINPETPATPVALTTFQSMIAPPFQWKVVAPETAAFPQVNAYGITITEKNTAEQVENPDSAATGGLLNVRPKGGSFTGLPLVFFTLSFDMGSAAVGTQRTAYIAADVTFEGEKITGIMKVTQTKSNPDGSL
ncbi:MAG: BACON domain-containing carbohydrate-binding protein [Mucinivorans sp.]